MTDDSRRRFIKSSSTALAGFGALGVVGTAAAATGKLAITVYADEVVDGELSSTPFEGVTVSDGVYEDESNHLGVTDADGRLQTSLETGEHSLELFKQTSTTTVGTTSTEKRDIGVEIRAGETTTIEAHLAPKTVTIYANDATEYGEALYVTGETDYLGNWETAYKMLPAHSSYWKFEANLPVGAEYRIGKTDWIDQVTISTDDLTMEKRPRADGANRTIDDGEGYYDLIENTYPRF